MTVHKLYTSCRTIGTITSLRSRGHDGTQAVHKLYDKRDHRKLREEQRA